MPPLLVLQKHAHGIRVTPQTSLRGEGWCTPRQRMEGRKGTIGEKAIHGRNRQTGKCCEHKHKIIKEKLYTTYYLRSEPTLRRKLLVDVWREGQTHIMQNYLVKGCTTELTANIWVCHVDDIAARIFHFQSWVIALQWMKKRLHEAPKRACE